MATTVDSSSNVTTEPDGLNFVLTLHYPDMDEMYMMKDVFWWLVIITVAYLAFVLKIGPDLMKNRPPFQLKNTICIYNLIQVILSMGISYLALRPLLAVGIIPRTVPHTDPVVRKMMNWCSSAFYLGKFTELLDTIFFVLRKKNNQISFLHVYHHSSVIIGTWSSAKWGLSHTGVWGAFMNANVHVVMYFYYFMAALGPQYQKYLWWKSYITTFQMFQFATVFTHQILSLMFTKGTHSIVGIMYVFWSSIFFFSLFFQFYQQNYKKKEKKEKVKKDEDEKEK